MFRRVLVGVDGRLGGRDAIALASRLTEPGATITLAHVFHGSHNPIRSVAQGIVEEERGAAQVLLERERSETGVDARLVAIEALSPGRGMHELAEREDADLLVLGTCRHGTIGRAVLGNDTRDALLGAPCAVAVAPAGLAEQDGQFATIGVGYDGSPESVAALALARALAEPAGARIRALQIVSYQTHLFTDMAPGVGDWITEMVDQADARMKALPGVEGRAEYGLPGQDLAAFSKEVDLLIVGSRGYGPARALIAGSTAGYLQSHARSALLILPRGTDYAAAVLGENPDEARAVSGA
ncbi:MAG: universal stress protein [Solirubrobacteraceae bacterium]